MALIVADASRCNVAFANTLNSVTWSVALGFHLPGGYDETAADEYALTISSGIIENICPRLNENVEMTGLTLLDLSSATGSEGSSSEGGSGSVSGNIATVDQCLVGTWLTGARGRSNRGRSFWRGLSTTDYEDNTGLRQWKVATVDAWQTAITDLITFGIGNAVPLAVISRAHSSYRVVTTATARAGIFSQRRTGRQPG